MKKYLFLFLLVLLLSCSGNSKSPDTQIVEEKDGLQTTEKILSTDVQILDNDIIYDGTPYTGEVWTKDGKSAVINVSDGRFVKITYFHKNGNPAVEGAQRIIDGRRSKRVYFTYYDINGYELTEHEWETKYADLFNEVNIEKEFPLNVTE